MITTYDLHMLRAINQINQWDVAEELGVSLSTYKRWEKYPEKMPKLAKEKLAEMLRETKYEFEE